MTIIGQLADGEQLEVRGQARGGVLYSRRARNMSADSVVSLEPWAGLMLRLGKRGVILLAVSVLVCLGLAVRFIPQIYVNTPFGLHEYRAQVHSTCEQIAKTAGDSLLGSPNASGNFDRATTLRIFDSHIATINRQYELLFEHRTPQILVVRRDKVEALIPGFNDYAKHARARLRQLPAHFTLEQFQSAATDLAHEAGQIGAQLDDTLTALAGGDCHVV